MRAPGTRPLSATAASYYVRPDGGDTEQCDGLADAPYPGIGTGLPCAWDHPFRALPPEGPSRVLGGDTVIIGAGKYRMGHGTPGAEACDSDYPWDCHLPPLPSGPETERPTRLLGAGWDAGCPEPPQLWGAERASMLVNLEGSSHVEVACLELTDHSDCVPFHPDKQLACERDRFPYGDWAEVGISASDSADVRLRQLNIHGLGELGVRAGRLIDWTIEDVRLAGNGLAGWDGDIDGEDANDGRITFRRVTVEWNGCGESFPDGAPVGCWAQTAGGYGDGLGTGETAGHWVFEEVLFQYNTSDGLDLLYARPGSSIDVRRSLFRGNAGDQLKISGPATIENVIAASNCGYFSGQPFTTHVDHCRAGGSALALTLWPGDQVSVTNSTISGEGDCLVIVECAEDASCRGEERVRMRNNLFLGQTDFWQPFEQSCFVWTGEQDFAANPLDADYSLIHQVKAEGCGPGSHDVCRSPRLVSEDIDTFDPDLTGDSPAIDAGTADGAPREDFDGRPRDDRPDIGATEYAGQKVWRTPDLISERNRFDHWLLRPVAIR